MDKKPRSSTVRIEITWKTILKVLLALLLVFVAIKLWPLFQLLIVSILLAVPLYRLVLWSCHHGWPRWSGVLLASLALVVAVVGLAALIGPLAFRQASDLGKNLPKLEQELVKHVPAGLRNTVEQESRFATSAAFRHHPN